MLKIVVVLLETDSVFVWKQNCLESFLVVDFLAPELAPEFPVDVDIGNDEKMIFLEGPF